MSKLTTLQQVWAAIRGTVVWSLWLEQNDAVFNAQAASEGLAQANQLPSTGMGGR